MKYLGTILSFGLIVYAAFAAYKFGPLAFKGAVSLSASIYRLISAR